MAIENFVVSSCSDHTVINAKGCDISEKISKCQEDSVKREEPVTKSQTIVLTHLKWETDSALIKKTLCLKFMSQGVWERGSWPCRVWKVEFSF